MKRILGAMMLAAVGLLPVGALGAEGADNSQVNQRDNGKNAASAEQQSNADGDVETSRQIRRALTDDKSLSVDAQNVKIITRGGHVLLKGPVKSQQEKRAVETIARRAAGKAHVTSELTVAAH